MKVNTYMLLVLLLCLSACSVHSSEDIALNAYEDTTVSQDEGCGCGSTSRSEGHASQLLSTSTEKLLEINVDPSVIDNVDNNIMQYDMVFIPGGKSFIGTNTPIIKNDGEGPMRPIVLSPYLIDRFAVTNTDFAKFVDETGFVSEGETFGWSFVFHSAIPQQIKIKITQAVLGAEWWLPVNGSYWREPEGPVGADVFATDRARHPVVQVSWNDAVAYCKWRHARLPTEAEWENAARGPSSAQKKSSQTLFPWGNKLVPNGQHRMNVFQGRFPVENTIEDGWEYTCPVDAYGPQNEYGLYNMIGNVWEWVHDWFGTDHMFASTDSPLIDPLGPAAGQQKVKKGGSFLCHRSYCYRYRTVARFPSTADSGASNIGFRCARSATLDEITKYNSEQSRERYDEYDDEL